jgi:hypothetical protein
VTSTPSFTLPPGIGWPSWTPPPPTAAAPGEASLPGEAPIAFNLPKRTVVLLRDTQPS